MSPRPRRRSGPVFLGLALLAFALAGELGHARLTAPAGAARLERERAIVRALGLTDTALFTEARYTRNPALADLNSAFQDHPLAFDHFPSASIVPVPALPASGTLTFSDKEPAR